LPYSGPITPEFSPHPENILPQAGMENFLDGGSQHVKIKLELQQKSAG
jgi:hypothetical protein